MLSYAHIERARMVSGCHELEKPLLVLLERLPHRLSEVVPVIDILKLWHGMVQYALYEKRIGA